MKEFTDKNFKSNENGKKFCKQVENTVGKGEIARYNSFQLYVYFRTLIEIEQTMCVSDTSV